MAKILGQLGQCQQAKLIEQPTENPMYEGLDHAATGKGCKCKNI
jgi:hypothetical protein